MGRAFGLRLLRHHRLGGNEKARNRGGVLKRAPHHLGWVDDAFAGQIPILAGLRVEAPAILTFI